VEKNIQNLPQEGIWGRGWKYTSVKTIEQLKKGTNVPAPSRTPGPHIGSGEPGQHEGRTEGQLQIEKKENRSGGNGRKEKDTK